jgi:hypothetical protein
MFMRCRQIATLRRWATLWLLLSCAPGCCPCHPGFVVGGNWSLHVDNSSQGSHCGGGNCAGGGCSDHGSHLGLGRHRSSGPKSAVAATSPPLQPVPLAPVHDPTVGGWGEPMVAPDPHIDGPIAPPPLSANSQGSSWLFVRTPQPSPSGPSLAERRKLAENPQAVRRR